MYRTTVKDIYEKCASYSVYSKAYSNDSTTTGEDDEISRSLKMFAMLSAYKPEPPLQSTNPVDAIMQEFACNGYSSDDQRHYPNNMNKTSGISTRGRNLWKYLPSTSGEYYYRKPPTKRYNNNVKNDKNSPVKHCVFCENNNEPEAVVKSHAVRDVLGRVLCPKLRTYVCPICKASGDMAHTVKYCPQKPIITMEDAMKAESYRFSKSTFFKQHMKT